MARLGTQFGEPAPASDPIGSRSAECASRDLPTTSANARSPLRSGKNEAHPRRSENTMNQSLNSRIQTIQTCSRHQTQTAVHKHRGRPQSPANTLTRESDTQKKLREPLVKYATVHTLATACNSMVAKRAAPKTALQFSKRPPAAQAGRIDSDGLTVEGKKTDSRDFYREPVQNRC